MKKFFENLKKYLDKSKGNILLIILVIALGIFINFIAINNLASLGETNIYSYNDFLNLVEEGKVSKVLLNLEETEFGFYLTNEDSETEVTTNILYTCSNPKTEYFKEYLLLNNIEVEEEVTDINSFGLADILRLATTFALLYYMMKVMMPNLDTQKLVKKVPEITFEDIAGNKELKKDMEFIVEFLKNPEKMENAGARMPKGIILAGPPGTGKTLIAKAIAGTAGVPFYSASGSDFVEMYVGLGAKRVRSLFEEAKKNAPCIVFIDEIDAVGGKRGLGNNSEKDQTINALLTELDGFEGNSGIVTICATNRIDDLDNALIRPGRFDKHLTVSLPDKEDREGIIKIYTANKKFAEDVDFKDLANSTVGFSGADLEALINEAALITATKGKTIITSEEIDSAFFKMVMKGDKKENQSSRDKEELELVAWHESGHTLVTKLLTKDEVSKVTILSSTSGAGGVTFRTPPESGLHSKEYLEQSIKIMYGGRAAEEILYKGDKNKITTGASNDILQATKMIKKYLLYFGMDESVGMINLEEFNGNKVVSNVSDDMLKKASELSNRLYKETVDLLNDNKDLLEKLSKVLLEKETLKAEEINDILGIKTEKEETLDEPEEVILKKGRILQSFDGQ